VTIFEGVGSWEKANVLICYPRCYPYDCPLQKNCYPLPNNCDLHVTIRDASHELVSRVLTAAPRSRGCLGPASVAYNSVGTDQERLKASDTILVTLLPLPMFAFESNNVWQ
jgi:hypothetical protein